MGGPSRIVAGMTDAPQLDADVVVVGARCAGAATALLLARQGHDVLLVDRATFPSDTLSTHAIARGGVVQLARWGLLDAVMASGAPPIREVSFHLGEDHVVRKAVKHRAGVDHLVAPRRYVLDSILLDAAVRAGARVRTGIGVTGVMRDEDGRVTGVRTRDGGGRGGAVRARCVVGADGVRSRIARAVDAPMIDERPSIGAAHYTYVAGLDASGFEFHLGDRAFAGVFPTHGGEANVWICHPAVDGATTTAGGVDRAERFLDLLASTAPGLARRVAAARIRSVARGAVRLPNHVRRADGPGWALVGDAGYHRDPITGHGITDAFRDADLLAGHLDRMLCGEVSEREALDGYAADRLAAITPIFDLTCRLAAFPPAAEFAALQKELSGLVEEEARWLAARPATPAPSSALAA
jgi:flavin-dependent dehydrogenase